MHTDTIATTADRRAKVNEALLLLLLLHYEQGPFETSRNAYPATHRHIPEDRSPLQNRCVNLKTRQYIVFTELERSAFRITATAVTEGQVC